LPLKGARLHAPSDVSRRRFTGLLDGLPGGLAAELGILGRTLLFETVPLGAENQDVDTPILPSQERFRRPKSPLDPALMKAPEGRQLRVSGPT